MTIASVEDLKKLKRKQNYNELIKSLEKEDRWISEKMKNWLDRFELTTDLDFNSLKEKIKNDKNFALFFIKDPGKQNLTEKLFADIISNIESVKNFVNHPSNTNLFVVNGSVVNQRVDGVKSIDFEWITNGRKVYATQKYTNENGGAQDNQKNDIINFLKNCQDNEENIFFAILDGNYWKDKIEYLKGKYGKWNIVICGINEVEGKLEKI
jgi:hypothetical protein